MLFLKLLSNVDWVSVAVFIVAINTLFHLGIPFSLETWFAAAILMGPFVGSSRSLTD